jgi:hypothetical protein
MPQGTQQVDETKEPAQAGSPDDSFSDLFDEAALSSDSFLDDEAGRAAKTADEEPDDGNENKGTDDGNDLPPDDSAAKQEDWEQKYKTLQGMYNKIMDEKKASSSQKEPPPPTQTPSDGERKSIDYSSLWKDLTKDLPADMKSGLSEYETDWDVVSKYEGAKRDAANKRMLDYVNELFTIFADRLQPYLKATEKVAFSAREGEIIRKHPDYDTLKGADEVKQWIEAKPKFLQSAMLTALESGEPSDVIELLDQYKGETGKQSRSSNEPAAKQGASHQAPANERLKNLQVVANKTKGINATAISDRAQDINDFSSAFQEALQKLK